MAKEAKLTLRLVDAVSGPGKAAAASLGMVNRAIAGLGSAALVPARSIGNLATSARRAARETTTLGMGLSIGMLGGAKAVYELEKSLNVSVAAGSLTLEQRSMLMREAIALNADYAATTQEIVQAANQLLKSGLGFDAMMGLLPSVLSTAQAMDVDMATAANAVVSFSSQYRMAMDTVAAASTSGTKGADLFAYATNASIGNLEDFAQSAKYGASVWRSMNVEAEEFFGWQIALANAGIRGSSAGTALRSAPVSAAAPTPKARGAAASIGINLSDYRGAGRSAASGDTVAAILESQGLTVDGIEDGIAQLMADPALAAAPSKLAAAIVDRFADELGVATAADRMAIADVLNRHLQEGVAEIDMRGLVRDLREKGAGLDVYAAIFGKMHASKIQALDPDILDAEIEKVYRNAAGTSKRMREDMMAGVVGDVAEFTAAVEKGFVAIGASGVLADAARGISRLADAIDRLAESNPAMLRFGFYAAGALAVAAPLGWALGGLAAGAALLANPLVIVGAALGTLAVMNLSTITDALGVFGRSLRTALDPAIIAGLDRTAGAVSSFFSNMTIDDGRADAIGQAARNMGRGIAAGVNAVGAALPDLVAISRGIADFAGGIWTRALPQIEGGMASLRGAFRDLTLPKLDGIRTLTSAIMDFANRALPALQPAAFAGVDLIAASFNTLAAGAGAVARVLGGITTAFVEFNRGLYGAIDTTAIASIGSGLATAFGGIETALRPLRLLFKVVNVDIGDFAATAGAKVGQGVSNIVAALAAAPEAIGGGWSLVTGKFADMASFSPTFGNIISAVTAFADSIARGAERVAAAVEMMRDAVANLPGGSVGAFGSSPAGAGSANADPLRPIMPGQVPLPRKSTGGAVRRGMTYEINERGRETVTMGTNGYVTPTHRTGGGVTNNYINIHGSDPHAVVAEMERRMGARLRRSSQIAIDGRQ